jgi:HD-GYP domain-containing protein (c-di-GMP phosphodiesterase class II)
MSLGQIVAEIRRCSGTQFDPAVVGAFVQFAERGGAEVVINSAAHASQEGADHSDRVVHEVEKTQAYARA